MGNGVRLIDIVNLCQCKVSIEVDEYTSYYQTFEESLDKLREEYDEVDIPSDVIREMRDYGHIVHVQAYPRNPNGFVFAYGGSDQLAMDRVYDLLTEEEDT